MLQLDIERELNLRGKQSERQELRDVLVEVFARVRTEKVDKREFEKAGILFYSRAGKIVGVQGFKRRYRLKTLGFDPARISMEKEQKRMNELQKLKSRKDKDQEQER
ncbi:hypothetical protein [Winogradskyella sp. R77965]|uniref:hypothetical protein n=1 Tax=Winogradskyella sp. R77965 TaxID=3093872 RepID=UPI0037DC8707